MDKNKIHGFMDQSLQRETELQMEHKAQVQVRSSPIQVNNVLNYQNYEHFREIAG